MGFLSKSSKSSEASHSNALAQIAGMPLQAKLRYGQPNDSYEHEADRVADSVVSNTKSARTSAVSPALGQGISNTVQKSADEKNNSEINKLDPIQQKAANKEEKPVQKKSTDKQDDQKMLQKKPAEEKKEKPVQKKEAKKDEKPVQKKAANKEEKSVQKKAAGKQEEKPVQKKEAAKKDEKPVQKKEAGQAEDKEGGLSNNRKAEDPSIEQAIMAGKNSGKPMEDDVRKEMEHQFGTDFTHVTIHNDAQAHELCRKINAQAFTHGSHVYFAEGKYDPHTTAGKHLLAHELTHVVQQNGRVQKMVQKAAGGKKGGSPKGGSEIDYDKNEIRLKEISLPPLKSRNANKIPQTLSRPAGYTRSAAYDLDDGTKDRPQDVKWKDSVQAATATNIDKLIKKAKGKNGYDKDTESYYFSEGKLNLIGKRETLIANSRIPAWNLGGLSTVFDVDHIRELQLGGENEIDNMELLNFSANRGSGSVIQKEVVNKLNDFLVSKEAARQAADAGKKLPSEKTAKSKFIITFLNRKFDHPFEKGQGKGEFWSYSDIVAGKHLKDFEPMTPTEIAQASGKKEPVVYTSEAGGKPIRKGDHIPGIQINEFKFPDKKAGGITGSINITALANIKHVKPITMSISVYEKEGVIFGGYIPRRKRGANDLEGLLSQLEVNALSPVTIDEATIDPLKGMMIRGKINPTLSLVKGIDLDFFIEGDNFGISKTITAGDLDKKIPPFNINAGTITFTAGSNGLSLEGGLLFEIEKLGKGTVKGYGNSNGEFGITGDFTFDKKLFKKKSTIHVEYNNKKGWVIGGDLEIGKYPELGIESGNISVSYGNSILEASGTAVLKIKGVEQVSLHIKFGDDAWEIDGSVKLGSIGIIKGGEGQFKVEKTGDQYDVAGSGTVTPNIPGLSSAVAFTFHNDMFSVDVSISDFHYGRISGSLNVGITNEELSDGKPTGKASDNYRAFGESVLKLKVTDKIFATATLTFLETGDMEVKGGITLPEKFEVVPPILDVNNKPIIDIPSINIPLFAIPLGVTDIGLDAVIAPRLTGDAHLGPGYLTNLGVEVDFKTSEPDNLTITGTADFEFMADASITAGVDFDVRANAVIASISGGVGLSGTAGIKAEQPVIQGAVKYSPKTGFELDGEVKAIGKPFLSFKGDLHIKGSAGVWPLKVSHTWTWPIGEKDVSVDAPLGFSFHFGYSNGKADFPSFDQWKWYHPEFNMDLMKKIKAQMIDPIYDEVF